MNSVDSAHQRPRSESTTNQAPPDLQWATLQAFARLAEIRSDWSRQFVACFSSDLSTQALALAVLGLGGVVLLISSDAIGLRAANRAGATDFQVDSLTEASRILKNELRKGTAVSVGLLGEAARVAQEMLHRGVQPDFVALDDTGLAAEFLARDARSMSLDLGEQQRSVVLFTDLAESGTARKQQDARLRKAFQEGFPVTHSARLNQRWLTVAPRLFPRDRFRHCLSSNAREDA